MKSYFGSTALAAALAFNSAASAQEAGTDWSGAYVGFNAGIVAPGFENGWCPGKQTSFYDENNDEVFVGNDAGCRFATNDLTDPGMMYGGHIGLNRQSGNFVWGVEADMSLGDVTNVTNYNENPFTLDDSDVAQMSIDGMASIRARAGLSFGSTLVTASAGLGYITGEFAASSDSTDLYSRVNISQFAPVVGATAEHRVSENVSLRANLSHYFADDRVDVNNLGDGADAQNDFNDFSNEAGYDGITTLTVGLSYHF